MSEGQKFISRNRAPRVQIQYELETNGKKKMVELPFIVGVMSDLAGASESPEATKAIDDRKFLDIDIDNFDKRMAALRPKISFNVENALGAENGSPPTEMGVTIEFASMEDFSPVKVAQNLKIRGASDDKKPNPLQKLIEARTQLSALKTYMDGKAAAEGLLNKILDDPSLLKAISAVPKADPSKE